ncbi:MAG TPA: hypothetical protein VIK03_05585 [Thermoleophilia bacterium]
MLDPVEVGSTFEQRRRHAVFERGLNTLTTVAEGSSGLTLDGGHRMPTERFVVTYSGDTSLSSKLTMRVTGTTVVRSSR